MEANPKKISIGDWIRFYNEDKKLVCGVVNYFLNNQLVGTDIGVVNAASIVEIRSAPEKSEDAIEP